MLCTPPASFVSDDPVLEYLVYWSFMTFLGFVAIFGSSGGTFYALYVHPSFAKWQYKTNPEFPSLKMVRLEIVQTVKGIACSTVCPAASVWLSHRGYSQAYCGLRLSDPSTPGSITATSSDIGWLVVSAMIVIVVSDFLEWVYHYLGHTFDAMWEIHKPHHIFSNPSPFSVIADEPMDQFMRSTPLLLLPLLLPINMDLLFFAYAVFFYGYGVYLHSGYEMDWIVDAHHPWINSAFSHYIHHARSGRSKAYHTGFFFKLWDQWAGTLYGPTEHPHATKNSNDCCPCSKCCRNRGERSELAWQKIQKTLPNYSPLLSLRYLVTGEELTSTTTTTALAGKKLV